MILHVWSHKKKENLKAVPDDDKDTVTQFVTLDHISLVKPNNAI